LSKQTQLFTLPNRFTNHGSYGRTFHHIRAAKNHNIHSRVFQHSIIIFKNFPCAVYACITALQHYKQDSKLTTPVNKTKYPKTNFTSTNQRTNSQQKKHFHLLLQITRFSQSNYRTTTSRYPGFPHFRAARPFPVIFQSGNFKLQNQGLSTVGINSDKLLLLSHCQNVRLQVY